MPELRPAPLWAGPAHSRALPVPSIVYADESALLLLRCPVPLMARILVVDDDDDVRELIELALDGQDHHVDSVGTGQAALALLDQDEYDLVVCDMHMPGVDGPALYGTAQTQLASVPSFVFVTGYADVGPYEDFIRTTQAPVLGKPFDIRVLRETVRRVLSGI